MITNPMITTRPNRKIHFFFSLGFLIVLLIGLAPRMAAGERLLQSLFGALADVRPVEWIMYFVLWYTLAKNNLREGWFKPPQTLGLADRQ
jgi:hypothetical protein